jgi:hypothetical protein
MTQSILHQVGDPLRQQFLVAPFDREDPRRATFASCSAIQPLSRRQGMYGRASLACCVRRVVADGGQPLI